MREKLSDVAKIIMGQSPPGDTYNDRSEGLPFFQGKAEFGDVSPTAVKWCTDPIRIAEAGDILMSVRAPVGPTNLADTRCCIGRGLAAIRADAAKLEPGYLRYFLRYSEPRLAGLGQGSTFAAIGRADIAELQIPLPQLDEQRRIADLMAHAEKIARMRREAEARAGEIIPALFADMFGDPERNSRGWPSSPLRDLVTTIGGGTPSKARADLWDGTLPWVSPKDMKKPEILDSIDHVSDVVPVETTLKLVPEGAVLIVVRGMILLHTVPIAIARVPLTINQDMKALVTGGELNADYLMWLLRISQSWLLSLVSTAAHGTRKIDTSRLERMSIPVPPLAQQLEFAARAKRMREIEAKQARAAESAAEAFNSILEGVFTPAS